MQEKMEIKSLDDLLNMIGNSFAQKAREWSDGQWRQVLQRATRDMAHDILRNCPDLPLLASVVTAPEGVATFITLESEEAEFTICVNATRKAAKTDKPTYGVKTDSERREGSALYSVGDYEHAPTAMHADEHGKAA